MIVSGIKGIFAIFVSPKRDRWCPARVIEIIQAELEECSFGAAVVASSPASSLMIFVLRAPLRIPPNQSGYCGPACPTGRPRDPLRECLAELPARIHRAPPSFAFSGRPSNASATPCVTLGIPVHGRPPSYIGDQQGFIHHCGRCWLSVRSSPFSRAHNRRFGLTPGTDRKTGGRPAGHTVNTS